MFLPLLFGGQAVVLGLAWRARLGEPDARPSWMHPSPGYRSSTILGFAAERKFTPAATPNLNVCDVSLVWTGGGQFKSAEDADVFRIASAAERQGVHDGKRPTAGGLRRLRGTRRRPTKTSSQANSLPQIQSLDGPAIGRSRASLGSPFHPKLSPHSAFGTAEEQGSLGISPKIGGASSFFGMRRSWPAQDVGG